MESAPRTPMQQRQPDQKAAGKIEADIEALPAESVHEAVDEKSNAQDVYAHFDEVGKVKQGLHQRHIQMIALAGTIGTGLFLSSGRAVANAGPLGAWLGYTIIGITVCNVVFAVAEMGTLVPLSGSIVRFSEFFVDRALGFASGWNMVYSYIVSIPSEIVAAAVLVEFWVQVNNAIWITVFGLLIITSSLTFVRVYGELEFGLSLLKIFLVVFINVLALVITCGGGPNGESIGFRYWNNPGPFVQYLGVDGPTGRFLGFWSTFNSALYAYGGIHVIVVAAAETKNPRTAIPSAAKRVFWRVFLFYVLTMLMVGLVVSSDDPNLLRSTGTAAQSPFVIAAQRASIKVVPSIINAIVLTSAWSSGNSNMLTGSILYGLANAGQAPKIFARLNRFGIPYVAVGLLSVFIALGYMTLQDTASEVFTWLQDLVSISTLCDWIIVLVTYLRFYYGCKVQGIDRKRELPWSAPFQPWFSWISLALYLLLLLTSGYTTFMNGRWSTETFISSYFNIPFLLVLYFGYKI